jgi:hypothetical protein
LNRIKESETAAVPIVRNLNLRQFAQVVDQIDEAKRLIYGGSLSQLRMALLLLDNAVELIAHRAIETELAWNRYRRETEKTLARWAERGEQEYLRSLRERLIDRATEKKLRK